MNKRAYDILRVGLGITFIWVGVLIYRDPLGWAGYIQPWALKFIPGSLETTMIQTGIWDIAFGLLMLFRPTVWLGALLGAMHLVVVLVTAGITEVTVRDIGLLFAAVALLVESFPENWIDKLKGIVRR